MTSKKTPDSVTDGDRPCGRLLVIDDPEPRSGPVNMALDEILLDQSRDGLPRLRFYRWAEPTVSFGCFEPVAAARRLADGRAVVRRPTGGGMVEHGSDLTYSLIVPRVDPFVSVRPAESYRMIHTAVAGALARAGRQAAQHLGPAAPLADDNACFLRPVLHDLIADGHKVAGGAQRRTRAGLLHQGSVQVTDGADTAWADALRRFLPPALAGRCEPIVLTGDEIRRANELATAKYAMVHWTNRI